MKEKLIWIDLEHIKTIEEVSKTIQTIMNDGGSTRPFGFIVTKPLIDLFTSKCSEQGTILGVPIKVVKKIEVKRVREAIYKICVLEIGEGQGKLDYKGIKLIQEMGLK